MLSLFEEDLKVKMGAEFEIPGEEEGGQDSSPVVTVSTPPPSVRLSERKLKSKCFRCRKQGHWAQDCHSSTPIKKVPSQPSTPPPDVHHLPVLRCHCGVACTLSVSRSDTSYGRRYYARNCGCGHVKGSWPGRNFYKWCEDVKAPLCRCGAGACTINFREDSYGNYVKYYTCRIRTGHGSCGFLLFETLPSSFPRSMELDKGRPIWSPQHGEPPHGRSCEDEFSVSSSNRNVVMHEAETSTSAVGKGHRVSRLMSLSDIRSRQIKFQNRISAAGNSSNGCKALQIMGRCVNGWVGRLAFPPPRALADPPLWHLFRCLLPLFDPILVAEYANIAVSESSCIIPQSHSNAEGDEKSQNVLGHDTQPLAVPLGTSSRKRLFASMHDSIENPMWKEVGKYILSKDLSLLVSMEPSDHNTMLLTANDTFDALARPLIEYEPSAECTRKSNQCISRVAAMELTLQNNCNRQEPTVQQNIESAPQVASHFQEMLHQIGELQTFLLNIAKDLGQSMRSMQATCQELTKALKLPQAEVEQCMVGTVLDEASSSSNAIYRLAGRKRQKTVE